MTPTRYEDRTKDELLELAAERDLAGRSSMTKDELIAALRGEEPGAPEPEAPKEKTKAPKAPSFASRINAIEDDVNALAEDWVDEGNGFAVHVVNIRAAVEGLRHAQTAWAHLTESPVSAGEARG